MASRLLDKTKPFDTVHGGGIIKYYQNGRHYNAHGQHLPEYDAPVPTQKQKKWAEYRAEKMAIEPPSEQPIVRKLSMFKAPEADETSALRENARAAAAEERYSE